MISRRVETASKEPYPHLDAKPVVKRAYEAVGADRMIWGGSGANMAEFEREVVRPNVRLGAGSRTHEDTRAHGAKTIQVFLTLVSVPSLR